MTLWQSISTWVQLIAGALLIITGGIRWFVAEPPGPVWLRGAGSRDIRRLRGRAYVMLGFGLILLSAGSLATAANRPALGAPMTLVSVILVVGSVILNVRATKQHRGELERD